MAFSYSFHMSNKGSALKNGGDISNAGRHNLREYKQERGTYNADEIEMLIGSSSVLDDVKEIYHSEFDEALEKYNAKQTRNDRKINDYFEHISAKDNDVACEFIIQVGDMDFWKDKSMQERKQMTYIFQDQLRAMQKLVPELKVASAVIHYDEKSPHMHVIGVPVADGYTKGLEKQVSKRKVFTKERLSYLQDRMRENVERGMRMPQNANLFAEMELKAKEKGRNKDIPKQSLAEFYELEQKKEMLQSKSQELNEDIAKKSKQVNSLSRTSRDFTDPQRTEPLVFNTPEGQKFYMPIPELQRQSEQMTRQIEANKSEAESILAEANSKFDSMLEAVENYETSEREKIDKELAKEKSARRESLEAEIRDLKDLRDETKADYQKAVNRLDSVQEISKYMADDTRKGVKVKSQEIKDGMFSSHTAVVVEGLEVEQVRDIFRASAMKKGAVSEAQSIVQQSKAEADQMREQAQKEIQQANNIISQQQQIIQQANEQSKRIKEKAERDSRSIIETAKAQANEIVANTKQTLANLEAKISSVKAEISRLFTRKDNLQGEVDKVLEKANIKAEEIIQQAHEQTGTDRLYAEINERLGIVPYVELAEAHQKLSEAIEPLKEFIGDREQALIDKRDYEGIYTALRDKGISFSDTRPWALRQALENVAKCEQAPHSKEDVLNQIQHDINRSQSRGISR